MKNQKSVQPDPLTATGPLQPPKLRPSSDPEHTPRYALSVTEFCAKYRISAATFYRRIDDMPAVVRIGRQRRILREDEHAWRRQITEGRRDDE